MEKVLNEKYSAEYNEELRGLLTDIREIYYHLSINLLNVAVKGPLKKWDEGFSIGDIYKGLPIEEMDNCDDHFVRKIRQILKSMFELIRDADMLDDDENEDNEDKTARFAVLYKDDNPEAKRCIWARIVDGELTIELQDIGPLVEKFYGDSDYERTMSGISARQVGLELGATNEDELMQKLIEEFGTNDGFDRLGEFLRENKIEYEYSSY